MYNHLRAKRPSSKRCTKELESELMEGILTDGDESSHDPIGSCEPENKHLPRRPRNDHRGCAESW